MISMLPTKTAYSIELDGGKARLVRTNEGISSKTPALTFQQILMVIENMPSPAARAQALAAFKLYRCRNGR
jgi:hypothetical protein